MDDLVIDDALSIPSSELTFEASRSSGPGGQHVNKASTKVTVVFEIDSSSAFDEEQKARLRSKLSGDSILRVSSQRTRSQLTNRDDALEKLAAMIRRALEEEKPRRKTRPTRAAREKRLEEKKRKSEVKQNRSIVYDDRER